MAALARLSLILLLALPLQATATDVLQPFAASYTANWQALPFSGKAERSLVRQGEHWQLQFKASAYIASITETSTFSHEQGRIIPLHYSLRSSGLGKTRNTRQNYNHQNGQLTLSKHKSPAISAPIVADAMDQFSAQLALQMDVAQGQQHMTYQVQEGDELDSYEFRVSGEEIISTPAGKLLTTRVERVRHGASKRKTVLWFANDWNFMLVQLQQVESDGKEYVIKLKSGSVNGRTVRSL